MTVQIRTVATQAAGVAKNAPLDVRRALQAMIDKRAKEQQDSAKVTLSEFGKLQARMLQVRQSMNSIGEARKSAARAHAAQLRQQIEGLKKIAVMLGPVAAKTLLRQIKHLAQQVRQIAAELAQSSSTVGNPGAMTGNVGDAALNGDLSVDANVDFGTNAETENGEWTSAADTEREVAAARTETSAGETVEEEGDESEDEGDKSVAAQAEQAAQSAEREIRALEEQEDEKNGKTTGIDGSSGFAVNSRDEARQKQEDVLLVRDLV
ncbi:MAG: hypothetical protein LBF51_02520 [Zoogloeaceae bacterium]|nr:hypothetical protein [Zoogloeaceae bacterium]